MPVYPRRVLSTATLVGISVNDGTSWVTSPSGYKGDQTFNALTAVLTGLSSGGGWSTLPNTTLRTVYKTAAQLDAIAPSGVYRQDQLTADQNRQFNVWQSAAWNGFGFFYQAAGGHTTGYIHDLLMLRVADPVGVFRLYEPQPPVAVFRNNASAINPAGVGPNCYIPQVNWGDYPTGNAKPLFEWGARAEHQYMGWMWDATRELLVAGGDQQACTSDTTYTPGAAVTFRASVNIFNPYASTPKQSWTRVLAPASYAPNLRTFIGGVQNSNGTFSFRSVASEYFTATVDPVGNTIVTPSGVTAYPNNGSFGSMFRDPATNKYYEIISSSYLNTTGSLWNRTDGVKVCDLPCYLGASGGNFDDNHPAGVIRNGYLFLFGHPSACTSPADVAPLAAWRVNLATGAIDTFNDGTTVSGAGVNQNSLTLNGFHGRVGFVSASSPPCFVLQVSPKHDVYVFRPPASWGL